MVKGIQGNKGDFDIKNGLLKRKIIIGITGASGSVYAKQLIDRLTGMRDQIDQCGLIFSKQAIPVWEYEQGPLDLQKLPFTVYDPDDMFAPMASGSAGYDAMIIIPCSMGTLGRMASGISNDLMTRAADVMLKERRKLILVPREAPFNLIHLRNMTTLTEAGAVICPASPSFYTHPETMDDLVRTVTDRVLTLAGFPHQGYQWGEDGNGGSS